MYLLFSVIVLRQFRLLQCVQVFNIEGGDAGEPATRRETHAQSILDTSGVVTFRFRTRLAHAATPDLQENLAYYSRIILKSTEDLLLFVNNVLWPSNKHL